jgi:hypothetical protein
MTLKGITWFAHATAQNTVFTGLSQTGQNPLKQYRVEVNGTNLRL